MAPNTVDLIYGKSININSKLDYAQICFDYIHHNPVKAGLVVEITDWLFSSARDYFETREGDLVNKTRALEFIEIKR
jgi:putative transposase